MIDKRLTETTRPALGPMDLNRGSLAAPNDAKAAGLAIGMIFVASIGAAIVILALPKPDPYAPAGSWLGDLIGWRLVPVVFGTLLALLSTRVGWYAANVMVSNWQAHQKRLELWNRAQLKAFTAMQGQEVVREYSQLELNPNSAANALLVALYVHYRLTRNNSGDRSVPYSVRNLDQLWLGGTSNAVLLGKLSGTDPEKMSKLLADLGLVVGRKPNTAGQWNAQTFDDVFSLFAANWHKLKSPLSYNGLAENEED